jgi:hypothetical protein
MEKRDKKYINIAILILAAALIYYQFGEIIGELLKKYLS